MVSPMSATDGSFLHVQVVCRLGIRHGKMIQWPISRFCLTLVFVSECVLYHAWCNELSGAASYSRYSKCQLHGTGCGFRLAMNEHHSRIQANISLYLDGKEIFLGVESSTNRFKQADKFCKSHG